MLLPVVGDGFERLKLSLLFYYCQADGAGLCKMGGVVWSLPLKVSQRGVTASPELRYAVREFPR